MRQFKPSLKDSFHTFQSRTEDQMTIPNKYLLNQACAFAMEFIKEAGRASGGLSNQTHEAAAQLRAALNALPPAIEGCACGCKEFNEVKR
jgi:hypothetical protein